MDKQENKVEIYYGELNFKEIFEEILKKEFIEILKQRGRFLMKKQKYKVAKYMRLSRDDGDEAESESIENQRDLIDNYIEEHEELEVVREYADDGTAGTGISESCFRLCCLYCTQANHLRRKSAQGGSAGDSGTGAEGSAGDH